jgi:hypothetical protein
MKAVVLILVLVAAASPAQPETETHYYDFRGGQPLSPELKLFGPATESVVVPKPGGLRITLPTDGVRSLGWGVALRYTLTGDFEATANYELLTLQSPTAGVGAGVALNALPSAHSTKFTKVGRFMHTDGLNYFNAELSDKENPRINEFNGVPAAANSGRLRLTRTGSTMHYFVADPGNAFREIAAWNYGTEDLGMVRFVAKNNGSPTAVDVLLLDLTVIGKSIPHRTVQAKDVVLLILIVGLPAAYLLIASAMRRARAADPRPLPDAPQQTP